MAGDGHFLSENVLRGTPTEPTLPSPPPWLDFFLTGKTNNNGETNRGMPPRGGL